ncbi:MAG: hypothetical protein HQL51_03015 [Magnetococcales bacterium]|nr:hypothetical protein [Magnetococcales bacterium]
MVWQEKSPEVVMFSTKKLFLFMFVMVGVALLQIWVIMLVYYVNNKEILLEQIIKDGSLFFFSTSLVYSSLFSRVPSKVRNHDVPILDWIIVGGVTFLVLVSYGSEFATSLAEKRSAEFVGQYYKIQIACTFMSIYYAMHVQNKIGAFYERNFL